MLKKLLLDLRNSPKKTFFLFLKCVFLQHTTEKSTNIPATETRFCKMHLAVTLSSALGFMSFFLNPIKEVVFMRMEYKDLYANPTLCHCYPMLVTTESNKQQVSFVL